MALISGSAGSDDPPPPKPSRQMGNTQLGVADSSSLAMLSSPGSGSMGRSMAAAAPPAVSTYIVAQSPEVLVQLLRENENRGLSPAVYTTPASAFNTLAVDFKDKKATSAVNSTPPGTLPRSSPTQSPDSPHLSARRVSGTSSPCGSLGRQSLPRALSRKCQAQCVSNPSEPMTTSGTSIRDDSDEMSMSASSLSTATSASLSASMMGTSLDLDSGSVRTALWIAVLSSMLCGQLFQSNALFTFTTVVDVYHHIPLLP